jgi:CheY-like chemotaxis protein
MTDATPATMAAVRYVLVVDDDFDIRDIIRLLLEADGYRVLTAGDGQEAWDRIEGGERPSLMLLDLMMPRMDGEQLLERLRAALDSTIPVVILSGHCGADEVANRYHASGWLAKPIDLDDLMATVHRLLPRLR